MTFVEIVHQDDVLIEYAPNIITQVGELFLFVSGGGDGMYFTLDDDVWPVDWVRANAHRLVTEHGPGRHRIEHPGQPHAAWTDPDCPHLPPRKATR